MVKGFEGQNEWPVLILLDHREPFKMLVQRGDIMRPIVSENLTIAIELELWSLAQRHCHHLRVC